MRDPNKTIRAAINLDGSLGPWQLTASAMATRFWPALVAHRGFVYAIGGANSGGTGRSMLTSIERASIQPAGSLSAWEVIGELPQGRGQLSAIVIDDSLYVIGGFIGDTTPTRSAIRAPINSDGTLGAWVELAPMISNHEVVVASGRYLEPYDLCDWRVV